MTDKYNELLMSHLDKIITKWGRLEERGHEEGAKVRMSFTYFCNNHDDAEMLRSLFITGTDFDVEIIKRKEFWALNGNTLDTDISLEILKEWVKWMIDAGLKFQCVFDSWDFM